MRSDEAQRLVDDIMAAGDGDGTPPAPPTGQGQGQPYPQVPLGQILDAMPQEVTDQIMAILNSGVDDMAMTKQLKELLNQHTAELETVGVVPDYLAYVLVYVVLPQLRGQ